MIFLWGDDDGSWAVALFVIMAAIGICWASFNWLGSLVGLFTVVLVLSAFGVGAWKSGNGKTSGVRPSPPSNHANDYSNSNLPVHR